MSDKKDQIELTVLPLMHGRVALMQLNDQGDRSCIAEGTFEELKPKLRRIIRDAKLMIGDED